MITEESKKLWGQRFRDRTHDAELYRIGMEADPKLNQTVFSREWHAHGDYEKAENTARTWTIWRGMEEKCDSKFLEKYR